MLKVDLTGSTKEDLATTIAAYCGELGLVQSVVILYPTGAKPRAFALVTMTSMEGREAVMNMFGDGRLGSMAVIRLEQEGTTVPRSLLRNATGRTPLRPS